MTPETIGAFEIVALSIFRFWPALAALAATMSATYVARKRLGLIGLIFRSAVGTIGLAIVLFWVFAALFADWIAPMGPLEQTFTFGMKKSPPGSIDAETGIIFLWGADNLARDVFSRIIYGARIVLLIAPAATLIAFMVGATLGLPAGYRRGAVDAVASFLANLVLAFPLILLFYLLVTPEVRAPTMHHIFGLTIPWSIPIAMAALFFLFPVGFLLLAWITRYGSDPLRLSLTVGPTLAAAVWLYPGLVFGADWAPVRLDPNELNVFAAVVLGSSPGVFRIVRGLAMDIKTRDYVAAAQTRGESLWYVLLWEILPNARGPLIVDFCLRIGYTTILLGTLGFFGLGLEPESPDWGSMINHGRSFVRLASTVHMALAPAIALMTLVLGLNLLADGLREQSLQD